MTVYTNGTKECKELEKILNEQNIDYTIKTDIEEMKEKGILALPVIEVDGNVYNRIQTIEYVRGLQSV